MNENMKKIVLWLFVIMVVSFSISAMLFTSSGVTLADFMDTNSNININMNTDKDFDLNDFANIQNDKELEGKFKETINDEKILKADNIESINVDTVSSDVKFFSEDRDDIKVLFEGAIASSNEIILPELIVENKNNTLSIEVKHKSLMNIGFYSSTIRVHVYIPKTYLGDVVVKTVSGDIDLGYIGDVRNANLKSVSGDIKAESLYTEKTTLKSTSGDMKIEDFKGELDCGSTSGDLYVNVNKLNNNISSKSVSGDMKIELPDNAEFYLESKSTSGDIDCEFPISIQGKLSEKNINGRVGNGENRISVSTISGDIKITN